MLTAESAIPISASIILMRLELDLKQTMLAIESSSEVAYVNSCATEARWLDALRKSALLSLSNTDRFENLLPTVSRIQAALFSSLSLITRTPASTNTTKTNMAPTNMESNEFIATKRLIENATYATRKIERTLYKSMSPNLTKDLGMDE